MTREWALTRALRQMYFVAYHATIQSDQEFGVGPGWRVEADPEFAEARALLGFDVDPDAEHALLRDESNTLFQSISVD